MYRIEREKNWWWTKWTRKTERNLNLVLSYNLMESIPGHYDEKEGKNQTDTRLQARCIMIVREQPWGWLKVLHVCVYESWKLKIQLVFTWKKNMLNGILLPNPIKISFIPKKMQDWLRLLDNLSLICMRTSKWSVRRRMRVMIIKRCKTSYATDWRQISGKRIDHFNIWLLVLFRYISLFLSFASKFHLPFHSQEKACNKEGEQRKVISDLAWDWERKEKITPLKRKKWLWDDDVNNDSPGPFPSSSHGDQHPYFHEIYCVLSWCWPTDRS